MDLHFLCIWPPALQASPVACSGSWIERVRNEKRVSVQFRVLNFARKGMEFEKKKDTFVCVY